MTTLHEADVLAIVADTSKVIAGDIAWRIQPTMTPASKFRVSVATDDDHPLFIEGFYNPSFGKLSFSVIFQGQGRIYGLDLGRQHRNMDGHIVEDTHKVRWTEGERDRQAYEPQDITASWSDPLEAWRQFCLEANLRHEGRMIAPVTQGELAL
ncbi:MAG: hypothetical protein OXC55_08480 [Chloroflexi bacterium]|nr:hypothetical protein [Chloroflexota bacterium]